MHLIDPNHPAYGFARSAAPLDPSGPYGAISAEAVRFLNERRRLADLRHCCECPSGGRPVSGLTQAVA